MKEAQKPHIYQETCCPCIYSDMELTKVEIA